jgi:hypothetical protein
MSEFAKYDLLLRYAIGQISFERLQKEVDRRFSPTMYMVNYNLICYACQNRGVRRISDCPHRVAPVTVPWDPRY